MVGGQIRVVMTLDNDNFTVNTEKAGQVLKTFKSQVASTKDTAKELEGGVRTLATSFKDLVFSISILRFAFADFHDIILRLPLAFVKAAGEMERMVALMQGLSKETDEAKQRLEAMSDVRFVFNMAQNTPFQFTTITDMFVKFKTAGIDPTNGSLKAFTSELAKMGASDELAKRAAVAIQQMAGKGVVSMEELRQQLGEAIPNAMQLMARGAGMSMAAFTKAVSKGTVEAKTAIEKMFLEFEIDSIGAMERMMKTLPGSLAQLKSQFEVFKIDVGNGGLLDVAAEQVRLLSDFFKSEDGKRFARDLGEGLKELAKGLVTVKDMFIELWPLIKLAGEGLMLYFGVRAFKAITESIGGQFAAVRKQLEEQRLAERTANLEKSRAAQEEIERNQIAIRAKQKTMQDSIAITRDARAQEIALAEKAIASSERQSQAETNLIRRRQVMYADYKATLGDISRVQDQMYATEARTGNTSAYNKELETLKNIAEARRTEISNLTQEIDKKRSVREATLSKTQESLRELQTQRLVNSETQAGIRSTQTQIANLKERNEVLKNSVANFESVANKASGALGVISSFGRTLVAGIGWTLAFTVAMSAVSAVYDSIAGAAKRAADQAERLSRIRANESTEKDLEFAQDQYDSKKSNVEALKRSLKEQQSRGAINKDAEAVMRDQIANAEQALRTASQNLEQARAVVETARSLATGQSTADSLDNAVKSALATSEAMKTYREAVAKETEAALAGTPEKDLKKYVLTSRAARIALFEEELSIAKRLFQEKGEQVKREGPKAVAAFENAYRKYEADLAQKIVTARKDIKIIGAGEVKSGELNNQNRESPLFREYQRQKAQLAEAQSNLSQLSTEAEDFIRQEENKEAFKLLADLVSGKFDIAAYGKDDKGLSPGGTSEQRAKLFDQFKAFADAGGSAKDFIEQMKGLDVVAKKGEESVRKMMLSIIEMAGQEAAAKSTRQVTLDLKQKDIVATQELTDATREYAAGVNYLPPSLQSVNKEMSALLAKSKATGDELKKLTDSTNAITGKKIETFLLGDNQNANKRLAEETARGITNTQDREQAAHNYKLSLLDAERNALRQLITDTITDEKGKTRALELLDQNHHLKRRAEQEAFARASKTESQRLIETWSDTYGEMDKVIANSTRTWTDKLFDFVTGTKVSFKDLFAQLQKDLLRVEFNKIFGQPVMDGLKAFAGVSAAKGAAGGAAGGAEAATAASLSTLNAGLTQTTQSFQLMNDVALTGYIAKVGEATIADTVALGTQASVDSAMTLFSITSLEANGALMTLTASALTAAAANNAAAASNAAAMFANGGIMSSSGPLPLKAYSRGGVADSPQLALFGEGSMNEAYVPLPDGRRIPVNMKTEGGASASREAPAVILNVINQTSQPVGASMGGSRFDGKQMVVDIFLSEASKPGPFRDSLRNIVKS